MAMARCGGALLLALLALQLAPAVSLQNGVGRTPALGWSSWNYFVRHAPPAHPFPSGQHRAQR